MPWIAVTSGTELQPSPAKRKRSAGLKEGHYQDLGKISQRVHACLYTTWFWVNSRANYRVLSYRWTSATRLGPASAKARRPPLAAIRASVSACGRPITSLPPDWIDVFIYRSSHHAGTGTLAALATGTADEFTPATGGHQPHPAFRTI